MLMPQDTKPHSQNLVCSKSNAKKNNKIGKIDTIILDDITEDTPKECVGGLKSPYQRRKSTKKKKWRSQLVWGMFFQFKGFILVILVVL